MSRIAPAELERRLQRFRESAKAAGIKLTHQRLEIFREVAASAAHPDADAILRALRTRLPTLSVDTVYRTLWTLHELGVVGTLGPRRDAIRFDPNLEPHHHFVCVRCGLVRDLELGRRGAVRAPAAANRYGRVLGSQLEVQGICKACERITPPRSGRSGARPGKATTS